MELEFLGTGAIIAGVLVQFMPVLLTLAAILIASFVNRRKLGIYGQIFDSPIGIIGLSLVLFWLLTALMADWVAMFDPYGQLRALQNKAPGAIDAETGQAYLFGGDALGRCVFSRMVHGSGTVMAIAPLATLFAYMVGITLGLPAGYYGGRLDTVLSFLANLILAFPVILLFYLLVTPEIVLTGIPNYMALFLFVFPIIFFTILLNSRFYTQPSVRTPLLIAVLAGLGWLYLSLVSTDGAMVSTPTYAIPGLPPFLDLFDIDPGILVVFVSVVFVNSPTVFRIVRGLAMDIKTRDYVAAAQTRGEGPWYIMLWEILPNARGPLIVDFCLRIGYTTILLGTLGFFGLGLASESPDWGTTINAGRRLLALYPHAAIAPAVALLTLVLGLNLLADGLREESLRD
jgi:peptide/nickel transport system permease protein